MTKHNKFMLSMAAIAILSGTNAVAANIEIKNDDTGNPTKIQSVKDSTPTDLTKRGNTYEYTPASEDETTTVEVKSELKKVDGMTSLDISAPKAELKVGDSSTAGGSLGGTAPTGEASNDGYAFTINTSKVTLNGKSTTDGEKAELNVNQNSSITTSDTAGTTLGANSAINIANGKTLTVNGTLTTSDATSNISINGGSLITNGDFTAKNGNIDLGNGSLTANGALNVNKGSKITFGEGSTLTINKALGGDTDESNKYSNNDFVKGAKGSAFDFSKGGTLILAAPKSEETGINITGTNNYALKLNNKGTIVLKDSSVLASIEEINAKDINTNHTGKIQFNGGTLATTKVSADASNFDFSNGGLLYFGNKLTAMDTSKGTAQTKDTGSTITGKTTLNSRSTIGFGADSWVHYDEIDTNNGTLKFTGGTLNVKNLTTSGTSLNFDATNGGTIELANDGKSTINGNLTLGDNANIKIISASGSASAGTLSVDKLSVTKTGKITLGGGELDIAQGLNIANAGSTADSEGNKDNIDIQEGGTINFNGGTSTIKGELKTTASKAITFDVNQNASVNFENLNLASNGVLKLNGGMINMGKLTTTDANNLSLTKGILNFVGDSESQTPTASTIKDLTLADDSTAVLNFGANTDVSIENDLDLSKTKASVNFYNGSLVKLGKDSTGTLTASKNLNLGGQVELGTLTVATTADSSLLNMGFGSANASLSGKLVGGTTPTKFTIGTDKDGNSLIGASNEQVEIGASSALTLKAGTITTNATLTTATDSKLVFGGGSLNVGAGGTLTIADTSKNLELKDGVGGVITLAGDSTKGGEMTIKAGDLDLSKTSMGIKVEQGGKLVISEAGKGIIGGGRNAISLTKFTDIIINGKVSGTSGITFGGTTLADAYKVSGDLTLDKDTTLGIITRADNDGNLKEIEVGKLTAADTKNGATLAFGNGGAVKLTGATTDTALKLNNLGFADKLTLGDQSVLEFTHGSVNVKGALGIEKNGSDNKTATLKVSNAIANLNGGLNFNGFKDNSDNVTMNKIELNNGALNIKADSFSGSYLDITHIQTNASGISSTMNIDGSADIQNSTFAILPLIETGATSYKVLSTTKGLTQSNNTGEFRTRNSLNDILKKYGLTLTGTDEEKKKVIDADKVIDSKDSSVAKVTLRDDGKNLFLERTIDTSSLSAVKQASLQADIDALGVMNKKTSGVVSEDNSVTLKNAIDNLTARKTAAESQSNSELAADIGGANSDILLSAFGVSSGAIDTKTKNAIALDIMKNGGAGIVADIKEGATSSSNMSSSTSSVMNTINLSNDMAISGRIAAANNPFANYASYDGLLYAALESDLPLYYANNGYMNGFWANAIGGLNKVEGESGTLVGLSVGFDRQLENTLVGFYLSYAMAGLNDKIVEQGSDNIQVGVYTSFNQRDIEVNVKAYGQLAVTETTAKRAEGEAEATFNRLYGGISANIGAIFAFNNNKTFIKPYIGENYYYAHTPAYEETLTSDAALSVKSADNHALSFDIGIDVRQYWNQNSFVYLTPSVERYVVNSGGDYTAGFIGSDTTFTIEGKSKTKTYVQALLGGNIALNDKFNVNLGVGMKKILNGQIERANGDKVDEMYLSGNLGVKYRF